MDEIEKLKARLSIVREDRDEWRRRENNRRKERDELRREVAQLRKELDVLTPSVIQIVKSLPMTPEQFSRWLSAITDQAELENLREEVKQLQEAAKNIKEKTTGAFNLLRIWMRGYLESSYSIVTMKRRALEEINSTERWLNERRAEINCPLKMEGMLSGRMDSSKPNLSAGSPREDKDD